MSSDVAVLVWCTAMCVCAAMIGIVRLHRPRQQYLVAISSPIQPPCYHADAIAVESLPVLDQPGELVAWWCQACETQLPAGFKALPAPEPTPAEVEPECVQWLDGLWHTSSDIGAPVCVQHGHRIAATRRRAVAGLIDEDGNDVVAEVYAVGQVKPVRVLRDLNHHRSERFDHGGWIR